MTDPKLQLDELTQRVAELERTVDALERALHIALASVAPGLRWLDATLGRTWPRPAPPADRPPLPDPVIPTR